MKTLQLFTVKRLGFQNFLRLCIILPLLVACDFDLNELESKDKKQCPAPPQTKISLIGGDVNLVQYPATFVIGMYYEDNTLASSCTGTFVGTDRLVTAAHCVADESKKIASIGFAREYEGLRAANVIRTKSWVMHPDYIAKNPNMTDATKNDLMFVFFPAGTYTQNPFAKFATKPAVANDAITLLGYGSTRVEPTDINKTFNVGTRKLGQTTIEEIYSPGGDAIFWSKLASAESAGDKPGIGHGDSGGPIYNAAGEITGLMRGFNIVTNAQQSTLYSWAVNVNYKPVADFISEQMNYKPEKEATAPKQEAPPAAPKQEAPAVDQEVKPTAEKTNCP